MRATDLRLFSSCSDIKKKLSDRTKLALQHARHARAPKAQILGLCRSRVFRYDNVCFFGLRVDVKLVEQRELGAAYLPDGRTEHSNVSDGDRASQRRPHQSRGQHSANGYTEDFSPGRVVLHTGAVPWRQVNLEYLGKLSRQKLGNFQHFYR